MQGERLKICVWMVLLAVGMMLSFGRAQVPVREAPLEDSTGEIAPDLALYSDVIHEVRAGRDYYEVAREKIPQYGFPIASPLNWRLPTYAWLLSRLPNHCWIQAALLVLGVGGLGMTFVAARGVDESDGRWAGARPEASLSHPTVIGAVTTFFMFGVVRWTFDGLAYLAQEPWAAVLIVVSLAAGALAGTEGEKERRRDGGTERQGDKETRRWGWRAVSITAGILALLFRELALPYCLVVGGMAAWKRRWGEAAAWTVGIAMFFGLFAWHVGQVKVQLADLGMVMERGRESLAAEDIAITEHGAPPKTPDPVGIAKGPLAQWLRFGGLDFVLLTTRMNSLLFGAPAWLLWLYLIVALVGLGRGRDETSQVACGAALLYFVAFAIVGRPENFYWGLLPAPLLVWGMARGLGEVGALLSKPAVAPDAGDLVEEGRMTTCA